ncbi:DUF4919 domain-containing protein [Flavobacterium sp. GCM10027622]|uniref:DUF4919 domain-containing protein n=1 Tax=unclassified Flavobacterium TaxID=196869 RepID=UPI0036165FD8
MKLKITLFLVSISSYLYSQSPLDSIKQFNYKNHFELILKETKNEKSDYSYSKQLKKFINDEPQTNFEVLTLLIGYSDNENFNPYIDILITDKEIYDLNEEGKFNEAIAFGNKALLTNPFMIKVMRELAYAYEKTGNSEKATKFMERTVKIYQAMFYSSSKTGVSIDSPFFSLGPKDGQYFLKYYCKFELGNMGSGDDKNGYFIDILEATVENKKVNFYFNIDHVRTKTMKK